MRKTAVIIAVIACIGTGSVAFGQINPTTEIQPALSGVQVPVTKWDVLSKMQNGSLEAGKYDATFSEEEVNGLIETLIQDKKYVDEAKVVFNDKSFTIRAHILKPSDYQLVISGRVLVDSGKATVKIDSAYWPTKIWGIPFDVYVPASFVERTGNYVLKKKSSSAWLLFDGIRWDGVSLSRGEVRFNIESLPR